jgi:hypothetical protein
VRRVVNLPIAIVYSRVHGWEAFVSYKDPFCFEDGPWSIYRHGKAMKDALAAVENMIEGDFRHRRT